MKVFATILLLTLSGVAAPQVVNIAGTTASSSTRESLRVPLSGVVQVSLPSGQWAVIQFISIGSKSATYKWKYRKNPSAPIELGTGVVLEKYEQLPARDGDGFEVLPLPGHDVIVRAGEIRAEWSAGGDEYCYFYFNPKYAKASLEPPSGFGTEP
jgi:hypothetical protein